MNGEIEKTETEAPKTDETTTEQPAKTDETVETDRDANRSGEDLND